jgi:chitodextrinase
LVRRFSNALCLLTVASLLAACGGGVETAATSANPGSSAGDPTPPTAPTGLTATPVSPSEINLEWTASTDNVGVTGYRIYRDGSFLTALGNLTSFQNTGLSPSTAYAYTVQAFDVAGNASGQSAPAGATTPATPDISAPSTPTDLTATAVSSSRIHLTWTASTDNVGVSRYRVYRNGAFLTLLGNVTSYQNTGLSPSTTYAYTVQALDAAGNASGQSMPGSATTLAQTPNGTAILTWDPVTAPNLAGYRIYYGTAPGTYLQPTGLGIDVGNVTSYTVTGLGSGTRYYFAATAYDTFNSESVFSNEVFKDVP